MSRALRRRHGREWPAIEAVTSALVSVRLHAAAEAKRGIEEVHTTWDRWKQDRRSRA